MKTTTKKYVVYGDYDSNIFSEADTLFETECILGDRARKQNYYSYNCGRRGRIYNTRQIPAEEIQKWINQKIQEMLSELGETIDRRLDNKYHPQSYLIRSEDGMYIGDDDHRVYQPCPRNHCNGVVIQC